MIKVSVIVPLYKAEKYLKRCVNSLLAQTLREIEIILVDDGSPDDSGSIAEEYSRLDGRIKVVHQRNGGVSAARNTGIEAAEGEYLAFADADDWLEGCMLEQLYEKASLHSCEIAVCGYFLENYRRNRREDVKYAFPVEKEMVPGDMRETVFAGLMDDTFQGYVWNKLYSRRFLTEYNILFPVDATLMEDCIFNLCVFKKASAVIYVDKCLYHYFVDGSQNACSRYHPNSFEISLQLLKERNDFIKAWDLHPKLLHSADMVFVSNVIQCILNEFNSSNCKSFVQKYSHLEQILSNTTVRGAVKTTEEEYSRLEKLILFMVKRRLIIGLFISSFVLNNIITPSKDWFGRIARMLKPGCTPMKTVG